MEYMLHSSPGSSGRSRTRTVNQRPAASKSSSKTKSACKQVTICESNNTHALDVHGQIFEFAVTSEV
eukprot:797377-Amphidinium_carterae.1